MVATTNINFQLVHPHEDWTPEEVASAEATVRNAVRLLDDASLLHGYKRYGTAFTLAVLALEEAGKVALRVWADDANLRVIDRKWSFHVRKQTAATALLQAEIAHQVIEDTLREMGLKLHDPRTPDQHEELRQRLARGLLESREQRLLELVAIGATEKTKHLGLYVDDWSTEHGLTAGELASSESRAAMEEGRRAVRLLRDKRMLDIANAIYASGSIGRQIKKAESKERRNDR